MDKIAILTDTNSGIDNRLAKELGVELLPMPFYIDEELFFEGETLSHETFYEKLESNANISTSQPSPGGLLDRWEELLKTYDSIVHIPMSSGLSGSCDSAKGLALEFQGKVQVVDNKRISVSQYQSVLDAVRRREKGYSAIEIRETLEQEAQDASIYVAVDTLKFLKKGGRITPAAAAIGSALKLKPVLQIQGDKLDAFRKVRGMKAAIKVMLDAIESDKEQRFDGEDVYIHAAFSGSEEEGKVWHQAVCQRFPKQEVRLMPLSLSVACHTGGGALGIGIMKKNT